MTGKIQQGADLRQVARVMQGFMQLEMRFQAKLPKEVARLQRRIDAINAGKRTDYAARYDLFHRISHKLYRKSMTMGELSKALAVPLSTATGMVDWLVSNGYACRLPDQDDRRIVRIKLTDDGQKLHETIEGQVSRHVQQLLSHLTGEERDNLFAIVCKLVSALEDVKG